MTPFVCVLIGIIGATLQVNAMRDTHMPRTLAIPAMALGCGLVVLAGAVSFALS